MNLPRRAAADASRSRRTVGSRIALLAAGALAAGVLVPLAFAGAAQASTPNGGDVVANLFEWNWTSVASECTNVLGPKGYGAVQVAPPQDSIRLNQSTHPWWEVYQPVGYDLNSRMGTAAQFAAMVSTCHDAGVKVYADTVLNHMAGDNQTSTDSYGADAFSAGAHSYSQPGYTADDFHSYPGDCPNSNLAINDWNNQTQVQECELVSLEDVKTESSHVRSVETAYLNRLVDAGVDGFRLDAAKHINENDLAAILGGVHSTTWTNSRPYVLQEVMPGGSGGLAPSTYEGLGQVIEFSYATALKNQFTGSISNLSSLGQSWGIEPSAASGTMVTNHDTERNSATLNYKAGSTYVLANIFHLAWGYGTPQVYASFTWNSSDDSPPSDANGFVGNTNCSSGWYCTDRVQGIANMVGWHNAAQGQSVANWYSDGSNLISFSRGSKAWVAINNGTAAQTRTFATGLPAGSYCDVIHGDLTAATGACSGSTVTVDSSGNASVTVAAKDAVALYGTGATSTPTPTPTASATPSPTPTTAPGRVAETFTVNGESGSAPVYLAGSIAELGSWAPAAAIPLTQSGSSWSATVDLPAGTAIQYKYIQKDASGAVTWESGSNHSATTGTGSTASVTDQLNGTTATPPPATAVSVTFDENKTTTWGSSVYVVGSIPALGGWSTDAAIALDSTSYPVWSKTVSIPPSSAFQYKYIVKDANGVVTWESGANRSYTTGSSGSVTLNDTWK